jgi:anionic cell wall polymer biosynthesis LytR-Cps2A-Psr (LCP) family protein
LEFFPCRFKLLHVDAGIQHMDGSTALQFVRSRHALGVEGSDFARSQRQAKVISAFKEKVFSVQTILNPVKVVNLYNILKASIDTDIPESQFGDFVDLANKIRGAKVQNAVIDLGDDTRPGLLTNPPPIADYGYAWVLVPKAGPADYSEIHSFVACNVTNIGCPTPTPTPTVTSNK